MQLVPCEQVWLEEVEQVLEVVLGKAPPAPAEQRKRKARAKKIWEEMDDLVRDVNTDIFLVGGRAGQGSERASRETSPSPEWGWRWRCASCSDRTGRSQGWTRTTPSSET